MGLFDNFLRPYRASGADLPYGDPLRAHGVAMEGYFWRITDVASGRVVIALIGVNRDRAGGQWATLGLAGNPGGSVRVDLGPSARLELNMPNPRQWEGHAGS